MNHTIDFFLPLEMLLLLLLMFLLLMLLLLLLLVVMLFCLEEVGDGAEVLSEDARRHGRAHEHLVGRRGELVQRVRGGARLAAENSRLTVKVQY